MLNVRNEQLAVLRRANEEAFQERVVAHLRRFFPGETQGLALGALRTRIAGQVGRGRELGLVTERDLTRFVSVLTVHELPREAPWMTAMLTDKTTSEVSARVDLLAHESLRRLKIAAKAFEDRAAYYGT